MKIRFERCIAVFLCLWPAARLFAGSLDERPNIVWIISEDNSAHWLGCYGDPLAKTPHIDALAAEGLRFRNAFSNASVCAPARCTLLMGRYATTLGTQNQRSHYPIPSDLKSYAQLLGEAGYRTSNLGKTDYNLPGRDKDHWSNHEKKEPWKIEGLNQPFMHVVNVGVTHESSLFARKRKTPIRPQRVSVDEVQLPPYLPDLEALKNDWATYHDRVTQMDHRVGQIVQSVRSSPHAGNTIIFYFSDHGGILPRAKRYIYQTGTQVPMIVFLPEKWRHLSEHSPGSVVGQVVEFVDLAPTVLELAQVAIPDSMEGHSIFGRRGEDYAYLFGQRYDECIFKCIRGITNGRFRYIRNFYPHADRGTHLGYAYGQAGWRALGPYIHAGKGNADERFIWETPQPREELYDVESDPWEVRNLADDPEYADRLRWMRKVLKGKMLSSRDTGLVPEMMYQDVAVSSTMYEYVRSSDFPYEEVLEAAWDQPEALEGLRKRLSHPHDVIRYWGCIHAASYPDPDPRLTELLQRKEKDPSGMVRFAAAQALFYLGEVEAADQMILRELPRSTKEFLSLRFLNLAMQTGLADRIPDADWNRYCAIGTCPKRLTRETR